MGRFQIGDYWLSRRPNSQQWCRTWFCRETRQTRRQSLGTADFREAQLRLAEWVTINQAPKKADDLPLAQILVRYWEHHGKHQKSADAVKYNLRHWSAYWGEDMLMDLTRTRQRGFLRHLRAKGLSDGYVQRIFTIGRAAINMALENGEIADAPPILYIKAESKPARVLTQDEAAALLDAVSSEHGLMFFALAFNTWARMEALLELNRFQCDLKRRLIHLNPPGRPQTKKYRPTVPITDTLLPAIESAPDGPLVSWYGRPIKSVKALLRDTAKRAGVGKIDSRTIRHTMATWAGEQGVPWAEIEFMLGHRPKSTSAIYAHFQPRYDGPAAIATDAFLAHTQLARTDLWKPHSFGANSECSDG